MTNNGDARRDVRECPWCGRLSAIFGPPEDMGEGCTNREIHCWSCNGRGVNSTSEQASARLIHPRKQAGKRRN
jgi:hypothetical protein